MKYLFILFALFLFSCDNVPIKVENPEKITTIEILNLAEKDTTSYKKVEIENTLYLISDNEVKYKVNNDSGAVFTLLILMVFLFFLCVIFYSLSSEW